MSALRQRAACIARRARPTAVNNARRSYASESHGHGAGSHGEHGHHHAGHNVKEGLDTSFYIFVGAIPTAMLVYSLSRPGKDGEPNSITKLWENASHMQEQWETRNTLRTAIYEQAAYDKHLFYNSGRNTHIELTYPEAFQHGSPYNVPAGHSVNLDKVVAHYRQQHLDEEERKAKKLAAKSEQ